jgi:hypothetical protein
MGQYGLPQRETMQATAGEDGKSSKKAAQYGLPQRETVSQDGGQPKKAGQYGLPDVDWSKLNAPTGEADVDRSTASPVVHRTASPLVNITEQDIKDATDRAMAFSGGGLGIKAYHSSPHDFEKFDLSKIGTGEGAQVYGHGLYFAENPAVSGQGGEYWKQFLPRAEGNERSAASRLQEAGFDRDKAVALAQRDIDQAHEILAAGAEGRKAELIRNAIASQQAQIDLLRSGKPVGPRTYEVDINAEPSQFLDWDKPFAEQPKAVQDIIRSSGIHPEAPGPMGTKVMSDLPAGLLAGRRLQDPSSMLLRKFDAAGIPGIRYLDEGSRSARPALTTTPSGDVLASHYPPPTRNYVVRNPDVIRIMRKYGIAGAAPLGAGALAAQRENANADGQ